MKILVLDNYDSFTYNLVYMLRQMKIKPDVIRNDRIEPESAASYQGIVFSPGPGIPKEAGNMPDIIRHHAGRIPMFGVCLGHQALAEYLGGRLVNMPIVFHGIQSVLRQTKRKSILFKDIPDRFQAGRYHSWEVVWETPQNGVEVIAEDEERRIMAFQETSKNLFGVQFHPESIMTPQGPKILENFISLCKQQRV